MKKPHPFHPLILCFFLCFPLSLSSPPNDTAALSLFRLQTDTHGHLLSNWTGPDACAASWTGVNCSPSAARVTALSLPSSSLRGPIAALSPLDQLRILDLHHNRLNATLLPLANCTNLKLVYLSDNDFSGEIPPDISHLGRLLRLDLSSNNIRGPIPEEVSGFTSLITLRLQNNELTGPIPDLSISLLNLMELNLTNNEFFGRLPQNLLKKFGVRSFYGNAALCGSDALPICSFTGNPPFASSATLPSNPSSMPQTGRTPVIALDKTRHKKGLGTGAIVAIVIANCVALLVITSFIIAYFCGRERTQNSKVGSDSGKGRRSGSSYGSEKKVYDSDGTNATDRSKLVFFEQRKRFELDDLLRASAEILGKGSLGTVYKAVLDDGSTVAVKRLKDANPCPRKEFEQYMDVIVIHNFFGTPDRNAE